jgi:hypothetical protein
MSIAHMSDEDRKVTRDEFDRLVNMTPSALRHWLQSEASQSVGMTKSGDKVTGPDQPQSVGHHMGGRIIDMKRKKVASLTDADHGDMRKVIGYIRRHLKQRPDGNIEDSRWRKSLMNWGHDPVKDEK